MRAASLFMRTLICVFAVFICAYSAQTFAQWSPGFTASLGRGYGRIALSQSVLSGTRRIGKDTKPGAPASPPGTLTYTPDPRLSDQMRIAMIDALSAQDPQLRPQMEQAFAGNAVLKEFDQLMSAHGYSGRNVADAMAELLVTSWEIVTDQTASAAQRTGAHGQTRSIFLNNPDLRAMSNADRQEMAEQIAYQLVISSSANKEYQRSGDRTQRAQLQQSAATMMRDRGIDVSQLRLTEQGFTR
jgi:hypothetical protein